MKAFSHYADFLNKSLFLLVYWGSCSLKSSGTIVQTPHETATLLAFPSTETGPTGAEPRLPGKALKHVMSTESESPNPCCEGALLVTHFTP